MTTTRDNPIRIAPTNPQHEGETQVRIYWRCGEGDPALEHQSATPDTWVWRYDNGNPTSWWVDICRDPYVTTMLDELERVRATATPRKRS